MQNRPEINRALSKALAYAQAGKPKEAQQHGIALIRLLETAGVFRPGSVQIDADTIARADAPIETPLAGLTFDGEASYEEQRR